MSHKFLTINLTSDLHNLPVAEQEIMTFLKREIKLSEEQLLDYKLIINELIINAIIHGNKKDPQKHVKVKVGVHYSKLSYIIVEDEGNGFEIESVYKDYTPIEYEDRIENIFENGRGLMIVNSLCETVKQNRKGNKIVALKALSHV
ncbi:ATP-binding protein [Caldicellulosiruptoraceae bacterium PP1]